MAAFRFHLLRQVARFSAPVVNSFSVDSLTPRLLSHNSSLIRRTLTALGFPSPSRPIFSYRSYCQRRSTLVLSQGQPKFEIQKVDALRRKKWQPKKIFKQRLMRKKEKRRAANPKNPRNLTVKKKRGLKFASVEERIKYNIGRARAKEALLLECLQKYEVAKVQGPAVKPHELTGEERYYLTKMAQQGSNYVPVGVRGLGGGVILNMHLHWKKHETVKVHFKPCKPGQLSEYVRELERLSGGLSIQTIGEHTAVFYRGKNYVQPENRFPIDTLPRKKALEKYKYQQSLENVRDYIAFAEKELELYNRHIALSSNEKNQSVDTTAQNQREDPNKALNNHFAESERLVSTIDSASSDYDFTDEE